MTYIATLTDGQTVKTILLDADNIIEAKAKANDGFKGMPGEITIEPFDSPAVQERIQDKLLASPMQLVLVNGQVGLYDDIRIPIEKTKGLYRYECREGEDEYIASIEEHVLVNFSGTMLFRNPLVLDDDGTLPGFQDETDNTFLDASMTIDEYKALSDEALKAIAENGGIA